jgi:hypothetical protein
MAEDDGLTLAPVLVVEIDPGSVLLTDVHVWHWNTPFVSWQLLDPAFTGRFEAIRRVLSEAVHR